MKRYNLFILLALGVACHAHAQEIASREQPLSLTQGLELIAGHAAANADYSDIIYWPQYYHSHPMDINTATATELSSLQLLTSLQIHHIIEYRRQHGPFISLYELQAVEDLDVEAVEALLPFIKINTSGAARISQQDKNKLAITYQRTLEPIAGYDYVNPQRRYLGKPFSLQWRYEHTVKNGFSYGIMADKDAGEPLFASQEPEGFDFYSAYVAYHGKGWLQSFIIGDYEIEIGQGLTMWTPFAIQKSESTLMMAKIARPPFAAHAGSASLLQGIAAMLNKKNWHWLLFASYKKRDGLMESAERGAESENNADFFNNLMATGYHRNLKELSQKNQISELLGGSSLDYQGRHLKAGISFTAGHYNPGSSHVFYQTYDLTSLNHPTTKSLNTRAPYQTYDLTHGSFFNSGFHYRYALKNLIAFGEIATDGHAGAALQGIMAVLSSHLNAGLLLRSYGIHYIAPYANGFGEGYQTNNENGMYAAFSYVFSKVLKINGYADLFSFPWLKYRIDAPSAGKDYFLKAWWKPLKDFSLSAGCQWQQKRRNAISPDNKLNNEEEYNIGHLKLDMRYKLNALFTLHSRIELSRYKEGNHQENGFLTYEEIRCRLHPHWLFVSRYEYFDIDGFDARIYAYETQLPYLFSIPSFQNNGLRWYFLAQYQLNNHFTLSGRIARTYYLNAATIGSGLDEILLPHKTDIAFQLFFYF